MGFRRWRPTINHVEATTRDILIGVIGIIIGAAVTFVWAYSERRQSMSPHDSGPGIPMGVEQVLSVLSSSAVLVNSEGRVLQASAPAIALGLVKDHAPWPDELAQMVKQVRRDGQVRESNFSFQIRRRPPAYVHARVAPLSGGLILVLVQDRTREHQVEAIRRDFVANVSHELKTPIGALNLLAEAVGEARDDPDAVVRFSERMRVENERLTRLVQQIIDLSRLQNDTASDSVTTVKVGELISEAVEHSGTDAEAKQIEISSRVEPDLFVLGDRAQLHSAVSNLVENAVTYSPTKSKVSVTAERVDDDVKITVSDNGIGIPDTELDRIFERFYRIDPARARSTGGTGLGLSIVKHVAASNGGTVEVWSKPGLGSSFTLVLPAWDPDEEQA